MEQSSINQRHLAAQWKNPYFSLTVSTTTPASFGLLRYDARQERTRIEHYEHCSSCAKPARLSLLVREKLCPCCSWVVEVESSAISAQPRGVETSITGWAFDDRRHGPI